MACLFNAKYSLNLIPRSELLEWMTCNLKTALRRNLGKIFLSRNMLLELIRINAGAPGNNLSHPQSKGKDSAEKESTSAFSCLPLAMTAFVSLIVLIVFFFLVSIKTSRHFFKSFPSRVHESLFYWRKYRFLYWFCMSFFREKWCFLRVRSAI